MLQSLDTQTLDTNKHTRLRCTMVHRCSQNYRNNEVICPKSPLVQPSCHLKNPHRTQKIEYLHKTVEHRRTSAHEVSNLRTYHYRNEPDCSLSSELTVNTAFVWVFFFIHIFVCRCFDDLSLSKVFLHSDLTLLHDQSTAAGLTQHTSVK